MTGCHHRIEQLDERLLAQSTDGQRGDRDAELHRRDEPRRLRGDAEHDARPSVPLLLELVHARPAHGDERVLGRDEVAVQQDERGNRDEL